MEKILESLHIMQSTDEKIQATDRTYISKPDVLEKLNLGASAFYDRLKFLEITPKKEGRKSYITEEEFELIKQLGEHIEATGSMEGFGTNGQLALRNPESSIAVVDDNLSEYEEEIGNTQSNFETQYAGIVSDAREHRTGVEMAKYVIASELDLEDLTPEQLDQIDAVKAATLPKSVSASRTAADILRQYRQGKI